MRKRKTERGGGCGADKTGERQKQKVKKWKKKQKEEEKKNIFVKICSPSFSPQTDAKADGGELAGNGQRRNETVY